MNISDLARDLKSNTSQLVEQLKKLGIENISAVSEIDDAQGALIKKLFADKITADEFKKNFSSKKKTGSTGKRRVVKRAGADKKSVKDDVEESTTKQAAETKKSPEDTPKKESAKRKNDVAELVESDIQESSDNKTSLTTGKVKPASDKSTPSGTKNPRSKTAAKEDSASTETDKIDSDSSVDSDAKNTKEEASKIKAGKEKTRAKSSKLVVPEAVNSSTIIKRVLKKNEIDESIENKTKRPLTQEEDWEETQKIKSIKKEKERKKFDGHLIDDDSDETAENNPAIIKTVLKKSFQKRNPNRKKEKHTFKERKKDIVIGSSLSVSELASLTGIRSADLINSLTQLGHTLTINQYVEAEPAQLAASEHGVDIIIKKNDVEDALKIDEDDPANLQVRPPVVTIMGHVDHGKTSLLDYIRKTDVIKGESGGITQHIGAYFVHNKTGGICFLDTPGHEAFTAMRARGANATDIVILVVSADDGPMPQTIEAINHAKAANVPIIVAINKCDKPDADPANTTQKLMEHGLISEEFGGDTTMVNVSAKTGKGIKELMEIINLQAEVLELKANPNRLSEGVVIESKVDKGRGIVVTLLIQKGTLRRGDYIVVGSEYGKIKALTNDKMQTVTSAEPSLPVEALGLNGLPKAGDKFQVAADEKTVKTAAEQRKLFEKEQEAQKKQHMKMEDFFAGVEENSKRIMNLIIKGDVIGSVEAISQSLHNIGNEKVGINVLHASVGAISNSDVSLASASDAIIIGFNVRPDTTAKKIAQEEKVDIKIYSIIYNIIDDIKKALEGMLQPVVREEFIGKAEVLEMFNISGFGIVAGSTVTDGKVIKGASVRILRDNIVVRESTLTSLRRFKDDVKEVQQGFECGIGVEHAKDVQAKDTLEFFSRTEESGKL